MKDPASETSMLQMSRVIAAPRERVFAAWTTPSDISAWFGPGGCRVLNVQVDLRVGGEYCFHLSTEQLGEIKVRGHYREVTPPAKLVYTWRWEGHAELTQQPTLVSVEFLQSGALTEVRLKHEELPSIESRDDHQRGWSVALDNLAKYLGD